MVNKDSKIIRPIDFKGKVIATHTRLTVHYLLVRLYLQRNGVDTKNDVTMSIVNLNELTGSDTPRNAWSALTVDAHLHSVATCRICRLIRTIRSEHS